MRLSIVATVASAVLSNASRVERFSPDKVLSHEDVGAYHTDAFEQLAERYSEQRPPSRSDMMQDVREIVVSYCAEGDSQCASKSERTVASEFFLAEQGPRKMGTYPADFAQELRDYIEEMHDALNMLDAAVLATRNRDDDVQLREQVLDTLADIQNRVVIHNTADTNDNNNNNNATDGSHYYYYKLATLSGLAVAMESSKLWHATYSNDNHPLYGLHHESYFLSDEGRRNLQNNPYEGLSPTDIARADAVTAIATVANTFLESVSNTNLFLLNAAIIIPITIAGSIAASVATISDYNAPETSPPSFSMSPTVSPDDRM